MNMHLRPRRDIESHLARHTPDHPVLFFSPSALAHMYQTFQDGFPGLVSYAVKANPAEPVLATLIGAGMKAFDVASPVEIALVRKLAPDAAMHYNNPVRSQQEIMLAWDLGVRSFSVDRLGELDKLCAVCTPTETEVTIRLKLPMRAAAYDFGTKYGADATQAETLMREAARRGYHVSASFHPGTQCFDATAWADHIRTIAQITDRTGLRLHRLNVGGGFPANRSGQPLDYRSFFQTVERSVSASFALQNRPSLLCEPGRALVADTMTLAVRVKARDGNTIFLNDGRYGALSEFFDIGPVRRVSVPGRNGDLLDITAFGPTCDSLDCLPDPLALPNDIEEGDYVLIDGMGAYTNAICTEFNGYGRAEIVALEG